MTIVKRRFVGYLWQRPVDSAALLPRVRLSPGPTVGLGFQWLTAWFHVWFWEWPGPMGTYAWWRDRCGMLDLLPHVWIHWSCHGSGVHVWFLRWRWHLWFHKVQAPAQSKSNG